MGCPYFRFKQFEVYHDRCAMKVGTDGVVLGAWVARQFAAERPQHILDIGTGSGLIALMLAQQFPTACITGIDIDEDAINQASDNFARSRWSDRLEALQCNFQEYQAATRHDIIVCNPPFFRNSLKNPDESRAIARHNDSMPYHSLINRSLNNLLTESGHLCIIIPCSEEHNVVAAANSAFLTHLCCIRTNPDKDFKRSIMVFGRKAAADTIISELTLETPTHQRSIEYQALTANYYL